MRGRFRGHEKAFVGIRGHEQVFRRVLGHEQAIFPAGVEELSAAQSAPGPGPVPREAVEGVHGTGRMQD